MFKKSSILILFIALLISPISQVTAAEKLPDFKKLLANANKITSIPKNIAPSLLKVSESRNKWFSSNCTTDFSSTDLFQCKAGNPNGKKLIVVYGDSHATMWLTAIDSIAKSKDYKVLLLAKLACPIVQKTIWSYQLSKPFTECDDWNAKAVELIGKLHPEVLIVSNQWKPAVQDGAKDDFGTTALWKTEFPKALENLRKLTQKLVVIGNNPSMTTDPLRCASKPRQNLLLCASLTNNADNHIINQIEKDAALSNGASYINTVDVACTDLLCPVVINDLFVYFDQWHFTDEYVKFLTSWLANQLKIS